MVQGAQQHRNEPSKRSIKPPSCNSAHGEIPTEEVLALTPTLIFGV